MYGDSDYNHVCEFFFKYMSFIVTDIQCVEINKDLAWKLSKTYNLGLVSEVREKNIICPVDIVVLGVSIFKNVELLGVICFPEINTAISSPNRNLCHQDIDQNHNKYQQRRGENSYFRMRKQIYFLNIRGLFVFLN